MPTVMIFGNSIKNVSRIYYMCKVHVYMIVKTYLLFIHRRFGRPKPNMDAEIKVCILKKYFAPPPDNFDPPKGDF